MYFSDAMVEEEANGLPAPDHGWTNYWHWRFEDFAAM
jgi:hypothetical protein